MQICLLSLLFMVVLARATEVNEHIKAGSYHKEFMHDTSSVVQDLVAEGDLEFYGAVNDVKQEEDRGRTEEDDDVEALGSIYDLFENSKEAHYIENYDNVLFDTLASHDVNSDHRDLVVDIPHVHCDCGSDEQSFSTLKSRLLLAKTPS